MIVKGLKETIATLIGAPIKENPYCIVAEFDSTGTLLEAANGLRKAGYKRFDVHSPFPVHGMDKAMGISRSLVPFISLGGGAAGLFGGWLLQYWINVVDYPLNISGKPFNSLPAFIPVMFELTILLTAFATIGGMFILNFLPMLYHPLFKYERFKRFSNDGFFLMIEARDKQFDQSRTRELLESLGGSHIVLLEP